MEQSLAFKGAIQRINITLGGAWFQASIITKDDKLKLFGDGLMMFSFEILDLGWLEVLTISPTERDYLKPFKEWKVGDLLTIVELRDKCEEMISISSGQILNRG